MRSGAPFLAQSRARLGDSDSVPKTQPRDRGECRATDRSDPGNSLLREMSGKAPKSSRGSRNQTVRIKIDSLFCIALICAYIIICLQEASYLHKVC